MVEELPGQCGLAGAGHALAEQDGADQGEFADRFEPLEEAGLGVGVRFESEPLAVGVQPFDGADPDVVHEAGAGHRGVLLVVAGAVGTGAGVPGAGVPGAFAAGVPVSPRRAVVSAAAKAAMRVEW